MEKCSVQREKVNELLNNLNTISQATDADFKKQMITEPTADPQSDPAQNRTNQYPMGENEGPKVETSPNRKDKNKKPTTRPKTSLEKVNLAIKEINEQIIDEQSKTSPNQEIINQMKEKRSKLKQIIINDEKKSINKEIDKLEQKTPDDLKPVLDNFREKIKKDNTDEAIIEIHREGLKVFEKIIDAKKESDKESDFEKTINDLFDAHVNDKIKFELFPKNRSSTLVDYDILLREYNTVLTATPKVKKDLRKNEPFNRNASKLYDSILTIAYDKVMINDKRKEEDSQQTQDSTPQVQPPDDSTGQTSLPKTDSPENENSAQTATNETSSEQEQKIDQEEMSNKIKTEIMGQEGSTADDLNNIPPSISEILRDKPKGPQRRKPANIKPQTKMGTLNQPTKAPESKTTGTSSSSQRPNDPRLNPFGNIRASGALNALRSIAKPESE